MCATKWLSPTLLPSCVISTVLEVLTAQLDQRVFCEALIAAVLLDTGRNCPFLYCTVIRNIRVHRCFAHRWRHG